VSDNLEDFQDPLLALLQLLREEDIPHVLIGGLAVSQLSKPRLTADIDVLTYLDDDSRIAGLIERASTRGFSPRLKEAEAFARQNRVLLLVHGPTRIPADISLGLLAFEKEVIERSVRVSAGELVLPLPTAEDLIILKAVAHRQVDLQDIASLAEASSGLDRKRIESVVGQFADALEMPEILRDLRMILNRALA
jgi:hypothetical protein